MIAFLALLFILLVIYALTKTKEGFNPMNTSPEHQINIPVNEIPSMLAPASSTATVKGGVGNTVSEPASNGSIFPGCDVKESTWPGMLPGPLPTAPYQQIAVGSPLPYQDTSLIKANRQQLINMLEMIKGFLAFEAQEISERSDPTIQLPLQTARTDFHVLQAEVEVLNRNPGIQPNITLSHLNEIGSNLAFLQSEVRLIGSAGPIQGPIYEFTKPVEGFVGSAPRPSTKNDVLNKSASGAADKTAIRPTTKDDARAPKKEEVIVEKSKTITVAESKAAADKASAQKAVAATILSDVVAANMPAGPSDAASKSGKSGPAAFNNTATTGNGKTATLKDLQDFIVRINCESVRLSSSGTSDPNMNARIVALADIKSNVEDIVNQVKMDPTMEANIPITKAELEKALPVLGKPSDPLPQIIKENKLSPGLANLLPSSMQNDPKATKEIGNLVNNYFETLMDGISFSVKYTSPREAEAGGAGKYNSLPGTKVTTEAQSEHFVNSMMEKKRGAASTIDKTGFPSLADLDNASNAKFTPMDSGLLISDRYAPLPSDAGRGPSRFDWKTRSKEIEGQVKKRGLRPDDFGIMQPNAKISSDFSWRGYARMICTRLQATMDPNMPVACGCPPMDWPGWRNAQ